MTHISKIIRPLMACNSISEFGATLRLLSQSRDFSKSENVHKYWNAIDQLNRLRSGNLKGKTK